MLRTFIIFFLCFYTTVASAETLSPPPFNQDAFSDWATYLSKQANTQGISSDTTSRFMSQLEFLPKVIELDRKQPDTTKTFAQYSNIILSRPRLNEARKKYKQHHLLLEKIGKTYGIQPKFIVALWAIESNFGQNMGGFNVLNSLATLAYEGRRSEFFRTELLDALRIIDEKHVDPEHMKGSWAGAMGQTQFMPSSFLKLAVDFDKDGKRDIWSTPEDVFASIANYLAQYHWDNNLTWGREVRLPKHFDRTLTGREIRKTPHEWQKLGVRKINGQNLTLRANTTASIIIPDATSSTKAYLVYSNYNILLKWNRSLYFATAVGLLADSIAN